MQWMVVFALRAPHSNPCGPVTPKMRVVRVSHCLHGTVTVPHWSLQSPKLSQKWKQGVCPPLSNNVQPITTRPQLPCTGSLQQLGVTHLPTTSVPAWLSLHPVPVIAHLVLLFNYLPTHSPGKMRPLQHTSTAYCLPGAQPAHYKHLTSQTEIRTNQNVLQIAK
jgi:hypothetical protein